MVFVLGFIFSFNRSLGGHMGASRHHLVGGMAIGWIVQYPQGTGVWYGKQLYALGVIIWLPPSPPCIIFGHCRLGGYYTYLYWCGAPIVARILLAENWANAKCRRMFRPIKVLKG